jgi:hypothetical protein
MRGTVFSSPNFSTCYTIICGIIPVPNVSTRLTVTSSDLHIYSIYKCTYVFTLLTYIFYCCMQTYSPLVGFLITGFATLTVIFIDSYFLRLRILRSGWIVPNYAAIWLLIGLSSFWVWTSRFCAQSSEPHLVPRRIIITVVTCWIYHFCVTSRAIVI